MDYGVLNSSLGRKVEGKFWGTRLEHIIGVAAALAVAAVLASQLQPASAGSFSSPAPSSPAARASLSTARTCDPDDPGCCRAGCR